MRFRNALLLIAVISLAVILLAILLNLNQSSTGTGVKYNVYISSTGFSPRLLNIKIGDTVIFTNKDTDKHWVASDIFPTNNVYPEKGGCIGSKFDVCHGMQNGEEYQFTFFYKGSWCYYDQLHPSLKGCVDVQ